MGPLLGPRAQFSKYQGNAQRTALPTHLADDRLPCGNQFLYGSVYWNIEGRVRINANEIELRPKARSSRDVLMGRICDLTRERSSYRSYELVPMVSLVF
jgi:hypothetical protein